ncbi:MAG TPA: hypothetical protein VFQ60_03365 [Patescibacteria group bacterium]|nr:hypothetical protein [Patescibacteria group bacterium]
MLIVLILIFCILLTAAFAKDAPWIPTPKKDVLRFIQLAKIKPNQLFYDLGCGDGRLVFAAAEAGAKAKGFEISLLPFLLANVRKFFSKNKASIQISYRNIWKADISHADLIYVWLTPGIEQKYRLNLNKN